MEVVKVISKKNNIFWFFRIVVYMKNKEEWRELELSEGFYSVSDLGKVRNNKTGRILKPNMIGGYYSISLSINKKGKRFYVHQLVAIAFLGHEPNGSFKNSVTVDHINNNKKDNSLSNLRLISNSDNASKGKGEEIRDDKYITKKGSKYKVTIMCESLIEAKRVLNAIQSKNLT